jgi:hypothetical protein
MIEPTDEMEDAMVYGGPTRERLAAVLAIAERDQAAALKKIKTSIDMHATGAGRFIARIVLDCECGAWGITTTLADWSNLASITESALLHLGYCRGQQVPQQVPTAGSQAVMPAPSSQGHEHVWQGGRCVASGCPDYCFCIAGGSGGHQRSPGRCPSVAGSQTAGDTCA